jgi:hypothetical protein
MDTPTRWSRVVQNISLPYLYHLGSTLERISDLPEQNATHGQCWMTLSSALYQIKQLTEGGLYAPYLRTSWSLSRELLTAIDKAIPSTATADESVIHPYLMWHIKHTWGQYRIALLADLGVLEAYFVVQQGGFNTHTLVRNGEQFFPSDLPLKVPEAVFDMREAAKCIAYAVPTAAGFHIFRVLEAVLRRYYTLITGEEAPESRNIGVYLNLLKQKEKGNPVIHSCLKQITDLHRNPLIHPEAVLTLEEALATHGIVRSVLTTMLAEMPIPPQTTAGGPTLFEALSGPAGV